MKSNLWITVEIMPGSHIPVAIREMCRLATMLDQRLKADANGVEVVAEPYSNPEDVCQEWVNRYHGEDAA
jgi:hypothetical protein